MRTAILVLSAGSIVGLWLWHGFSHRQRTASTGAGLDLPKPLTPQTDAMAFAAYAGSQSCRDCHREAFDSWAKSNHALAERALDAGLDRSAFEPPREISHGSLTSQALLRSNQFQIVTLGPSGQRESFPAERVIGVKPLRQFLIRDAAGRFQVSELAFDPASGDWFDVFGNEDRQPGEWGHWTGRGMTWNQMCASCHNTRLRKNYDSARDHYSTAMAEQGVGCETCHGPMADHVAWQRPRPQPAVGDPTIRRLTRNQMMDACGSCHARRGELTGDFRPGERFEDHFVLMSVDETDLYYPDGQVREEDYEYASFLSSRMFAAGVWCMDCHAPHSGKILTSDNQLCQRCHGLPVLPAPKIDPAAHSHHQPDTPGGRCVDCHMPLTTYMQRHPRRDHGFTIPDPLLTKQHGIPNACNRCHTDRDADWALAGVEKWYGQRMDRPSRARSQLIAQARNGGTNLVAKLASLAREEKSALWRAGATRLLERWNSDVAAKEAILEHVGDTNALVRMHAAHALAPLAQANDASALASLRHLSDDPARAVRVEAAWALRASLDTNSVAGQDLLRSLTFNGDQPSGALQFGVFLMDRGSPGLALDWFQRAVRWDGRSAPLRDALAVCLSLLGRPSEAVLELEAACWLDPKDAHFRYKLGLALNEAGKLTEAVGALEQAVQLEARLAQAWYNLGLGYSSLGRMDEALNALARAESIEANSARIPYARATILARLGRVPEARTAVRRALEIEPGNTDASNLLNALSAGGPVQVR
ncbi:MAG: ammonia-forming cytochrome c nitrite reductase subunit c552 [Verrucomicrobia bacterium]|nr:ammonia-forming cytochrome c nitrite reductase subunit c552 [Verrucomicrobiota bacterium]